MPLLKISKFIFLNNDLGPGLSPCLTFPKIRSCKVDFGTPCLLAACNSGILLSITSFMAFSISSFDHCFHFLSPTFWVRTTAGADLDLSLPRLLLFFGNIGWSGALDRSTEGSHEAPNIADINCDTHPGSNNEKLEVKLHSVVDLWKKIAISTV